MHRRAVSCSICGGRFFPASLPFHEKTCMQKHAIMPVPCPYCDGPFLRSSLNAHMSVCKSRPKDLPKPSMGLRSAATAAGAPTDPFPAGEAMGRMKCSVCGRGFAMDRIGKHQSICRKVSSKRRPVFDSSAQRVCGDGGDSGGGGGGLFGPPPRLLGGKSSKMAAIRTLRERRSDASGHRSVRPNWRQQHLEFQAAIRAARMGGKAPVGRGASHASSRYDTAAAAMMDTRVPCPHCGRRYADTVAERHIPKCKDIFAKPKGPPVMHTAAAKAAPRPYGVLSSVPLSQDESSHFSTGRLRGVSTAFRSQVEVEPDWAGGPVSNQRPRVHGGGGFAAGSSGGRKRIPSGTVSAMTSPVVFSAPSLRPTTSFTPPSSSSHSRVTPQSLKTGGFSMSNATSADNPLATSYYQTMDRPAGPRRR